MKDSKQIKQMMEIQYLKNLFNLLRKFRFKKIIVPSLKGKFDNIQSKLDDVKLLEYLTMSKHPFYVCNRDKCLKIRNRKKYFIFPNNKINKSKLFHQPADFDLFQILFFEDYENIIDINSKLNKRVKQKRVFDLELFLDNIYYDLHLISNADFSYLVKDDIVIIKFMNYFNEEKTKRIIEYFKLYQEDLDKLKIDKRIILDIGIKF